jgi:uncharacterized SAM-binding protein YcdF (DUF218 family)
VRALTAAGIQDAQSARCLKPLQQGLQELASGPQLMLGDVFRSVILPVLLESRVMAGDERRKIGGGSNATVPVTGKRLSGSVEAQLGVTRRTGQDVCEVVVGAGNQGCKGPPRLWTGAKCADRVAEPMIANPFAGTGGRRRIRWWCVAAAVILLDLLGVAVWTALCVWAARDMGEHADALVVLWGDDSRPGAETERRVARALELWRAGRAAMVICVGGSRPSVGFDGARIMMDALQARGVPVPALHAGTQSYDTVSNLREARELARTHQVRRVLVVADSMQTARILWFLRARLDGIAAASGAYFVSLTPWHASLGHLWMRTHHEWIALAAMALPDEWRARFLRRVRS